MKELVLSAPLAASARCTPEAFALIVASAKIRGPIAEWEDPFEEACLRARVILDDAEAEGRIVTVGQISKEMLKRADGAHRDALRRSARLAKKAAAVVQSLKRRPAPSTPDQVVERKEAADFVRSALRRLPEPERTVIALHYLEGLPFAEIRTRVAGKHKEHPAESTVRGFARTGLKLLRQQIKTAIGEGGESFSQRGGLLERL